MTALTDNWLAAEPLLVERLKAEVTALRGVYRAADLDALSQQSEGAGSATPSAHVFYLGDTFVADQDGSNAGEMEVLDQVWGIALVASNARGSAAVRTALGPLISATQRAIAGWDAGVIGLNPFRRASIRSTPQYNTGGKVIHPLFFYARAFA